MKMSLVKSVRRVTLDAPVPVFDVTNMSAKHGPDSNRNFVADGVVVHNCREARDPYYQEILPLKGKIMNALRSKAEDVLLSEEVVYILSMVGFDAKNIENPLGNLRTNFIVTLSDPDPDGGHISSLELALFYKFMPGLFKAGYIYIVDVPEYYSVYKGEYVFGPSANDLRHTLEGMGAPANLHIQHIKGWGEVPSELIEYAVFNPATRRLKQVTMEMAERNTYFSLLMSDDVQTRKDLLGV